MVDYLSAAFNAINMLLTFGLMIYALKIRSMFKEPSKVGKPVRIFAVAAFFLFLAAVFRAGLLWGSLASAFQPLEIGTRTIGFLLLFMFAYQYAQVWISLRK